MSETATRVHGCRRHTTTASDSHAAGDAMVPCWSPPIVNAEGSKRYCFVATLTPLAC